RCGPSPADTASRGWAPSGRSAKPWDRPPTAAVGARPRRRGSPPGEWAVALILTAAAREVKKTVPPGRGRGGQVSGASGVPKKARHWGRADGMLSGGPPGRPDERRHPHLVGDRARRPTRRRAALAAGLRRAAPAGGPEAGRREAGPDARGHRPGPRSLFTP